MTKSLNKKVIAISLGAATLLVGSYKVAQGVLKNQNTTQTSTQQSQLVAQDNASFFNQKDSANQTGPSNNQRPPMENQKNSQKSPMDNQMGNQQPPVNDQQEQRTPMCNQRQKPTLNNDNTQLPQGDNSTRQMSPKMNGNRSMSPNTNNNSNEQGNSSSKTRRQKQATLPQENVIDNTQS